MKRHSIPALRAVFAAAFTSLAGCATTGFSPPFTSNAQTAGASKPTESPIPYVANCGVLNTGTPSRFVCNGKVYTSFQLARIREEQAKKYASGN